MTGSREWDNYPLMMTTLADWILDDEGLRATLVHGGCPTGADREAASFWRITGRPVEPHPANWQRYGKAAGPRRNQEMVDAGADQCIAFFKRGAANRGTADCVARARAAGIPVQEVWG